MEVQISGWRFLTILTGPIQVFAKLLSALLMFLLAAPFRRKCPKIALDYLLSILHGLIVGRFFFRLFSVVALVHDLG